MTHVASDSRPKPVPRPEWVGTPPGLRDGVYETTLLIGPESDREACAAKLPTLVEGAIVDYVTREHGAEAAARLDVRSPSIGGPGAGGESLSRARGVV